MSLGRESFLQRLLKTSNKPIVMPSRSFTIRKGTIVSNRISTRIRESPMDDVTRDMWKGGTEPTSFPHLCPLRQIGTSKDGCIELGGANLERNQQNCCGTFRGSIKFEPCNSSNRRCVVCLEIGRRGIKANVVTNVQAGTCDEHTNGIIAEPVRKKAQLPVPADPHLRAHPGVTLSRGISAARDGPKPVAPTPTQRVPVAPSIQAPEQAQPPPKPVLVSVEVKDQGAGRPLKVPLSKLLRYEGQPRRYFNKVEIAELADDIQLNEQETPCRVFPTPGKPGYFTFIGGGRRERAFHLIAQRTKTDPLVDCVLGTVKDAKDHYRKAFRDNIKRKDYIPRDEADAYLQMYKDCEPETHEEKVLELMREAGKPRKHIENYLLVAGLPEEAKDLMNPDLLDKQLVYLVALEISRSTKDSKLRIELAKETSQQCMGLPQARIYIRQKTGHSNYGGTGRLRLAADDYQAFKTTLSSIRTRMDNMKENWDVVSLYKARPKPAVDRERDTAMIREMIAELEELLKRVEGKAPKPPKAPSRR